MSSAPADFNGPARSRKALRILGLALVLGVGWVVLLRLLPWRGEYAENNYRQNLLRIESLERRVRSGTPPESVLAGTSISGRILPSFFDGTALAGIANLGLDGTSPVFSLEMLRRLPRVPRRVFLETHALHQASAENESVIQKSLSSMAGRWVAAGWMFSTAERPSTVLYTAVKKGKEAASTGRRSAGNTYPKYVPGTNVVESLTRSILELRERGCEVILADLPVGYDWPPGPNMGEPVASELVRSLNLRRLDCRKWLYSRGFEPGFTDGIHLDGVSARETARALAALAAP